MARLPCQIKGGYYPAAPEAIREMARYVTPPTDGPPAILDPCAGQGEAIAEWASLLGVPMDHVHAIELEENRAALCRERLPEAKVLGPCSTFGCRVSANSLSFIWLNPPFDDAIGGGGRVEAQFLFHVIPWLMPGGVMALACPADTVKDEGVRRMFLAGFERISVVPFPAEHRPYNEVVVFGVKRKAMIDPSKLWWGLDLQECTGYTLPSAPGPWRFEKTELTETELRAALRASPLRKHLESLPEIKLPRPPLALGNGHLALLLASGHLDGLVAPDGEPPHVVRGVARKQEYLKETQVNEDSVREIYSERIEMQVRVLAADGTIRTLSSVPSDSSAK